MFGKALWRAGRETGWCSCTHAAGAFVFILCCKRRKGFGRSAKAPPSRREREKFQGQDTRQYINLQHPAAWRAQPDTRPREAMRGQSVFYFVNTFSGRRCVPAGHRKGGAPSAQGAEYGGKI
ncbi:MAG: hypothetical protein DBY17_02730 [Oscillospiraceae bacterium]|nr:MAG: hypothetical protein DBY17_02730 [Oscillospiraceae bacterium]